MKDIGVYIHIPFCKSKCYYCDFCSYPNMLNDANKYISFLKKEIDIYVEKLKDCNVSTIFIGGGTPTAIEGRYIYEIIEYIYKKLNANKTIEISIEANPKTLDDEKLSIYKSVGINRISIGVQSMNDGMLKKIGRIHTVEDFIKTYSLVRKHGFDNINLDLMFNLPEQTLDDSIRTLRAATTLEPEHISYYSLKIEEGTPFYNKYINKQLILPDEDTEREMYHRGIEFLEQKGYGHYEISNFAKKGYESKHNLVYWETKPYIGLGLSSHSYLDEYRYGNAEDFDLYFKKIGLGELAILEKEHIDKDMEIAEYMILGLRLIKGVNFQGFENRFKSNIIDLFGKTINKFIREGLLEKGNEDVKLTKKGLDLCNIVFAEILP